MGVRIFLQNWKIFIRSREPMSRSWGTFGEFWQIWVFSIEKWSQMEPENSSFLIFYWLQMVILSPKWVRSFILWIQRNLWKHFFDFAYFICAFFFISNHIFRLSLELLSVACNFSLKVAKWLLIIPFLIP